MSEIQIWASIRMGYESDDVEQLVKYIINLQQQNKDLQERIEKAKDKLQKYIMEDFDDMHICLMQELLEILEKKEV